MGTDRTAWHPLLVVLLRALLPREGWEVFGEYQLTREPLRIDVVVLRRKGTTIPPTSLLPSLVADLSDHTLVHFKGPTDELERDDASMLLAYAMMYMVVAALPTPEGLALRVVAPTITPRFCERIVALGGNLYQVAKGMHEGTLAGLPLRVVETSVVSGQEREHLLYALSPSFLWNPAGVAPLNAEEVALYRFLYQQVEQFKKVQGALMLKDQVLAEQSFREGLASLVAIAPIDMLLARLTIEERIAGLKPEERIAGLKPEERVVGLGDGERVLLLPDSALRALPESFVVTLAEDIQTRIRERLGS